jgi:hypothetical protein
MSRYAIKFPFRVRIHGGEFDESARAIHREDGLKTIQAESGIVLESTIERKQMSTKTTFKRIALVTVAALGFGVMSVAPSNAAAPAGFTSTLSAASSATVQGTAATTTVTHSGVYAPGDTTTTTVAITSWPVGATNASITASTRYGRYFTSGSSLSYGAGAQFNFTKAIYGQVDYMSYYNRNDISITAPSVSVGYKF